MGSENEPFPLTARAPAETEAERRQRFRDSLPVSADGLRSYNEERALREIAEKVEFEGSPIVGMFDNIAVCNEAIVRLLRIIAEKGKLTDQQAKTFDILTKFIRLRQMAHKELSRIQVPPTAMPRSLALMSRKPIFDVGDE